MRRQWRLKEVMEFVAVLAIYLASVHFLILGPSQDPLTVFSQLISFILLFFVMPLHLLTAWARSRG
jgi:Mn2+/Fe2+ NRAMP family transporter